MDDPLGDILSDGSNDSFFDEPKAPARRGSATKTPDKKPITDIFNLSDSKAAKKTDDWLGLDKDDTPTMDKKSPLKSQKIPKKISFENDDDDILGNLGFSRSKAGKSELEIGQSDKPSKIDLLESILGPKPDKRIKSEERTTDLTDILKESKARNPEVKSQSSLQSVKSESLAVSEGSREGRRGRRPSGSIMDPLGLFSNEPKASESLQRTKFDDFDMFKDQRQSQSSEQVDKSKPVESRSTPNITDAGLPNWLGGTPVKPSKSEAQLQKVDQPPPKQPEPEETTEQIKPTSDQIIKEPSNLQDTQSLQSLLNQQKLAHSNLEYQNTAIALQQQESQILMALQLKTYEDRLAEMQMKQQEVLVNQEKQFNVLMERQFTKQQVLENNMRLQQERINNHIQMLISQSPAGSHLHREKLDEVKRSTEEESTKSYENMINVLKQRQHEEIFLLEESYKKQISLLEQNLESVENRLKSDTQKLTEMFEDKLSAAFKAHQEDIDKYKKKIQELQEQHIEENKQIRENHIRTIDEIKFEYSTLIENLKQARQSETSLFNDATSYAQKLDQNINLLYNNSVELRTLKEGVDKDYNILARAREESIKAKEEEVALMKNTLEKCRKSAEEERAQLLTLVRCLETKIAEQNQNDREERWSLQQAASVLAARSAALDREADFNRTSIEREREQLKTLKESILAEQERMILQLTEEKLAISSEKLRLETASKLNPNYDAQRAKCEIDAAIQVAKEAAEMTDKERDHLHRQQCEVEKLKRTLLDQQKKLDLRESELDSIAKEAQRKVNDGEKALFQSKTVENQYNERLRELKQQLSSLSVREKRLAEEKISLSKERLALHTMIRQVKRCGLCAADSGKLEDVDDLRVNFIHPYLGRVDNMSSDNHFQLEEIEAERNTSFDGEYMVPIGDKYKI